MVVNKNINVKKGYFITFEGPDGSGKSSVVRQIYKYLNSKLQNRVLITREPGGNNNLIAENIRKIILDKKNTNMTPITEALLFAASRAQNIVDFILPNLKKNKIVICDRFVHSSIVYQGIVRNIGISTIKKINDYVLNGLYPDLIFVLLAKTDVCMKRIKLDKKRIIDRIDKESNNLHKKIYDGYKKLINLYPKNMYLIDANKDIKIVVDSIKKIIDKKIFNKYE